MPHFSAVLATNITNHFSPSFIRIDRQNHELVRWAEPAYNHSASGAVYSLSTDQILAISSLAVSLPLDDFSCQDDALHVENRQAVVVHLLFRMGRHNVEPPADLLSHLGESAGRHTRILRHGAGTHPKH